MLKRTALLALLFLLTITAFAQTPSGTIKGFVYDKQTGEALSYVTVIFRGTQYGVQTDINGYFSISLPPGSYTMFTTQIGYDTVITPLNVVAGEMIQKKIQIKQVENELSGVEISSRHTDKVTRINTGVTAIKPRDIKLLPSSGGEPDVAQFLQVVPGVVITGDQGGQLFIRGGSPAQTGILLDGITIYNPFHTIGLFSVFETEAIRNVDVYTAGFNAEYGNRTSAIVDVRTKDGNKNNLAGVVSVSPIMSHILLEGPIVKQKGDNGSSITFLVTAKSSYLDKTSKSLYSGLGEPFTSGLPYSFTDLYGKVTFSADNGSKLNLFGFNFKDDAGLLNPATHEQAAEYTWQATGAGGTFVVTPGNSPALIDGKFSYSKYDLTFNQASVAQPRTTGIDGFEAGINFTYFLPRFSEIKYGVEVSGTHTALSYFNSLNTTTTLDRQSTLASLYVTYRKNFGGKFIMEPSVRFQYYSELSQFSPEPRLGLKYNITDYIRLKASGGVYTQNLIGTKSDFDIVNFFTGFVLSPQTQITNTNHNPVSSNLQTAYHSIAGIEVDINRVELDLEPWYKDFTQLVEINRFKQLSSDPDFVAGSGKAYGIDFSAKYNYKRIYLWGVASYQKVTYTNVGADGNVQDYPPPFDRRFNLNLLGSYTLGKKRNTDVSVRFNLGSPFPFTQTQGYYEDNNMLQNNLPTNTTAQNGNIKVLYANEINGGRLSWYHRLDISAKHKFELSKKSSIDLTLSVTNVYDRKNIFYVDRITNIDIYQLPVFPSVSLGWNF